MGSSRRSATRDHLAYLAARLMAEDGIVDYASAKRKAARQAGVPDTRDLPDNREIEAALRAYQALYQSDTQAECLRQLREWALEAMDALEAFNPYLTGPVLTGTAGPHSRIDLQLFADSEKEVEMFLIDQRMHYEASSRRVRLGDRVLTLPVLEVGMRDYDLALTVYHTDDLRVVQKHKADGRPVERARRAQVEALLAAADDDGDDSQAALG